VGTPLAHSFGAEWKSNENGHFKTCSCGASSEALNHIYANGSDSCYLCGYSTTESDGLGAGAIVAIVLASVAGVGGGGFCLWWFVIRKKIMA